MSNISRDSFRETQNTLNDLRNLVTPVQPSPRHYVSLRLQQGVPYVDADCNEREDIRRYELETVFARAIGSGVPAGSDGFRIRSAANTNNFNIDAGLIFVDGWLVYNRAAVDYPGQPHRTSAGVAPALPPALSPAALARRDLVYLDAWESEVDSQDDDSLIDPRIGVESCTRRERVWVVRAETIAAAADPLAPATIPNRQPGHRYYPLALINRPPGGQITEGMISDLRRTHLTLDALTFAPLLIDDTVRGQRLDSARLAGAFRGNLDVMRDLLRRAPETFVYAGQEAKTWQAMTAFNDLRAAAVSFEQQALAQLLHRKVAALAMNSFYQVQKNMVETLQQISASGTGVAPIANLLNVYVPRLDGTSPADTQSLKFALGAGDLLGAVMAQERLNEAVALQSDTLPEGTVSASLISINPTGPLNNRTVTPNYQLTIRLQSSLTSTRGSELIRAIAAAGTGWSLQFSGTNQPDQREIVVDIPNQQTRDIVLNFSADPGAANTTLALTVRPERRQQLVYNNPPVTLALGQQVLPSVVLASLSYQGPALQPNNTATVSRAVMAQPGGVSLPFNVTNLSAAAEVYQVTVTPINPVNGTTVAATGWQTPDQPTLPSLNAGEVRPVNILFRITNQAGAVTPLTWRVQLVRRTNGVNEPQTNARFDLTFNLT